jgi:hypothetical protein
VLKPKRSRHLGAGGDYTMESNSTNSPALQLEAVPTTALLDDWFDPIEAGLRNRVREFIQELIEGELEGALASRPESISSSNRRPRPIKFQPHSGQHPRHRGIGLPASPRGKGPRQAPSPLPAKAFLSAVTARTRSKSTWRRVRQWDLWRRTIPLVAVAAPS